MDELSEHPSLAVRSGQHKGARFVLVAGRTVIGRHVGMCHVVLNDEAVTQKHAALERVVQDPTKPWFSVVDLESLNGVSVGGVRLSDGSESDLPESAMISAGDSFVVGDVEIVLLPAGRVGADGRWETAVQVKAERQAAADAAKQAPKRAPPPTDRRLRQALRIPAAQLFLAPTLLVRHRGGSARYHLDKESTLGSSPERSNIVVQKPQVSGAHVRFTHVSGRFGGSLTYVAVDLDSLNGLWVKEGARFDRVKSTVLQPGRRVHLDDGVELTLLAPGAFDLSRGEFVSCDETGAEIRSAAPAPERHRALWMTLTLILLLLVVALSMVLLWPHLAGGGAP